MIAKINNFLGEAVKVSIYSLIDEQLSNDSVSDDH